MRRSREEVRPLGAAPAGLGRLPSPVAGEAAGDRVRSLRSSSDHLARDRPALELEILGIPIACLERDDALRTIDRFMSRGAPARVYYANANLLNLAWEDPSYADVVRRADLVLNDGIGVSLAARMKGFRFLTNLNGSDFNPHILRLAAERGWSVSLVGGRPGVAARAAETLRSRLEGLDVASVHDGYFSWQDSKNIADDISRSGADLLMVGMGNPLQERWLDEFLEATGAKVGVAAGAFFDFQAGTEKRAPRWMNRAGIEWVYRLARHPAKLGRRYLIGNPKFLFRIASDRGSRHT